MSPESMGEPNFMIFMPFPGLQISVFVPVIRVFPHLAALRFSIRFPVNLTILCHTQDYGSLNFTGFARNFDGLPHILDYGFPLI